MTVVAMLCILAAVMAGLFPERYAYARETKGMKVTGPGGYAALESQAKSIGRVKVIVRVQAPFAAEPSLSEALITAQRSSIGLAQDQVIAELRNAGKAPLKAYKYKYVPYLALTVDKAGLAALAGSSMVTAIQEDTADSASVEWSVGLIGASTLQSGGVAGSGMAIAVLDTGVDKNHPFLRGSVVSEACYSSSDPGRVYSLCPGGALESIKAGSALPYGRCSAGKCDHGTHVAGIAAGRADIAGSPGPGVAPEAPVIAVQVFSLYNQDADCNGNAPCVKSYVSDQMKGLERVYDLRNTYTIAAVNMSLGGGQYTENCDTDSRKATIDNLKAAGIATIVASGNNGYCGAMGSPACISTAVSIGSTDQSEDVAASSNSATFLSLFAPGVDIISSIPGKSYAYKSGTSMAAPHVAGAWALIKEGHPTATVDEILGAFTSTGTAVTDSGKCPTVSKQRINVSEAYNQLGPTVTLDVTMGGTRKGTVTAGTRTCVYGAVCKWLYTAGTVVSLTGAPAAGAYLDEWTGCDTVSEATGVCTVTINSARTVMALFNPPPIIHVNPHSLSFGTVAVGKTPYKWFGVRNNGVSSLSLKGITPRAMDPAFTIDATECGAHLAKGQVCYVYVTFAPTEAGQVTGYIDVVSDDPAHETVTVNLAGRGK